MTDEGLQVQTSVLHAAGRALLEVQRELTAAECTAEDGVAAVAHPGLQEQLRHFAQGWRRRREQIVSEIGGLGAAAQSAAQTYELIECELVAALRGGQ